MQAFPSSTLPPPPFPVCFLSEGCHDTPYLGDKNQEAGRPAQASSPSLPSCAGRPGSSRFTLFMQEFGSV